MEIRIIDGRKFVVIKLPPDTQRKDKYFSYLKSLKWKKKRKQALSAARGRCKKCGTRNNLHIHHISYENLYKESITRDLAVLCRHCHDIFHQTFSKINKENYNRFLSIKNKDLLS